MRNTRKKAQDAKHVPPPAPTELPLPGISPEEAERAEHEWYDEAWDDISGIYEERALRTAWQDVIEEREQAAQPPPERRQ